MRLRPRTKSRLHHPASRWRHKRPLMNSIAHQTARMIAYPLSAIADAYSIFRGIWIEISSPKSNLDTEPVSASGLSSHSVLDFVYRPNTDLNPDCRSYRLRP
ncbi:hypothetical protein EVAR_93539_1 [Eumeta japonica]|uniref:Uncharacterized protein n=1 Tax=Eumeta variegata TaxID=151549 RepID=A0A4C1UR21_EUMVA|nr:hypothetical protein EVAR_93539_1 [Eumeta japonica]